MLLPLGLALALPAPIAAQALLWSGYMDQGRRAFDGERYADAVELFQAAVGEVETDPRDPRLAQSLFELGRTERRLGRSESAEAHLETALAIFEAELGTGAPETAAAMVELGANYRTAGELDLAEPLLKRGAAIREATSAPNDPALIDALREVALLAFDRGDLLQAETAYRRVLAAATQAFPPDSPQMTAILLPMARIYAAQGEYDRALPLLRRALGSAPPQQRPHVLSELAEVHREARQFEQAEARWIEAIEQYAALDMRTPESVQTLYRFAEYLRHGDRYEEARPYFDRALADGEEVHGKGARELIPILVDFSSLLWRTGHKLRATKMQTRAKWIRARHGKPDDATKPLD